MTAVENEERGNTLTMQVARLRGRLARFQGEPDTDDDCSHFEGCSASFYLSAHDEFFQDARCGSLLQSINSFVSSTCAYRYMTARSTMPRI